MAKKETTLLEELGGEEAVFGVCKELINKVSHDDRTKKYFVDVEPVEHNRKLTAFMVQAFGGPQKYDGKSMLEAHKDMHLNDGHVDVVIELLIETMKEFKVPQTLIDRCAVIAESVRDDVVGRKKAD